MPTKFEEERDAQRLARHQRVAQQIKETDQQMSRETSRTLLLYTGDIVPDTDQPRHFYEDDQAALQELAQSIKAVGVLSPIQVRPAPDVAGQYIIIVGERRWRACQMAGINRIEAVVREDWETFQIRAAQYEENEQRQDVSDVARARSLMAMRHAEDSKRHGWEEIAERVGLQRNQVMRLVALLQLPAAVTELVDRRLLPGTHGMELVRLMKHVPDEEVLAFARNCCAATPGGKARRPVKELARIVTDRLQAAHEASAKIPTPDAEPPDAPQTEAGQKRQKTEMQPRSSAPAASSVEADLLLFPTPSQVNARPDIGHTSTEAEPVRPFVVQLIETWKAGELAPAEQRLLREVQASHPLETET